MSEVKVCRICLRTEAKMYHYDRYQLKLYYEEVTALKVNDTDGLPHYFCYECATVLYKFHKFKEKCYSGQKLLKHLLWTGPITYDLIYRIDSKDRPTPSLGIIMTSDRIKTYTAKDSKEAETTVEEPTENGLNTGLDYLNAVPLVTGDDCEENEHRHIIDNVEFSTDNEEAKSPVTVYVDTDKRPIEMEREEIKTKRGSDFCGGLKVSGLDKKNWKITILSEDEALKGFRARAEDRKYLAAAFKCTDCFRGFSKKEMMERHTLHRHVESVGPLECRFCRMRFKLDCYLRKHMRQHYHKYECLRCGLVCPLEHTALVHEEYHSGVTRKCVYCDQEFRHVSTYYTHLRTHRSEHVCAVCGVSFVSAFGLRQHTKIKHVLGDLSSDDEESVSTYCSRCDIRFDTRRAYTEHLFHSALHDAMESDTTSNTFPDNKKILGKKKQAKITKAAVMSKTSHEDVKVISAGRKRGKTKRLPTKPMSCYQCGQHFPTQKACWDHHLVAHPRTSFYPPNERYICEICGASLAPGSVKMHTNMHSRETVHSCDTCGRQFHTTISLRRHLVTHTGEKPYACPLCEKRFTQNNSMKLHYRTFHLKQPYPKRTRRKKQEEPKQPGPEPEDSEPPSDDTLPEVTSTRPGIEPVLDQTADRPPETSVYLTLT